MLIVWKKNPVIAHILGGRGLFSTTVFFFKYLKSHRYTQTGQSEQKVKCVRMHDSTDSPLMSVCGSAKRHLTLRVYWPGPFCLSCSDHQISHPLLHSLWTSKLCEQEWADDGLQGSGGEMARVSQGSASCLISNEGDDKASWVASVGGCWMNQDSSVLRLCDASSVKKSFWSICTFQKKKRGESVCFFEHFECWALRFTKMNENGIFLCFAK